MSVFTVSEQEMVAAEKSAKEIATNLNEALKKHGSLRTLHALRVVNFTFNAAGHYALDHPMEKVESWYQKAVPIIDIMLQEKELQFGYGCMGSVWVDLDPVVVEGKSKKVRLYLAGENQHGYQYDLGMDATFEEEW